MTENKSKHENSLFAFCSCVAFPAARAHVISVTSRLTNRTETKIKNVLRKVAVKPRDVSFMQKTEQDVLVFGAEKGAGALSTINRGALGGVSVVTGATQVTVISSRVVLTVLKQHFRSVTCALTHSNWLNIVKTKRQLRDPTHRTDASLLVAGCAVSVALAWGTVTDQVQYVLTGDEIFWSLSEVA